MSQDASQQPNESIDGANSKMTSFVPLSKSTDYNQALPNHEIVIHDFHTPENVFVDKGFPSSSVSFCPILAPMTLKDDNNEECLIPDWNVLAELEVQARSISSNIDMALRDLRGTLRGMSDLTLESTQNFLTSINSSCDAIDATVKSTYSILAKTDELNNSMKGVRQLTTEIKDMKNMVDALEIRLLIEETSPRLSSS